MASRATRSGRGGAAPAEMSPTTFHGFTSAISIPLDAGTCASVSAPRRRGGAWRSSMHRATNGAAATWKKARCPVSGSRTSTAMAMTSCSFTMAALCALAGAT